MGKILILRTYPDMDSFFRQFGKIVDDLDEADMLVITGGADVHPDMYGDDIHPNTFGDYDRDMEETQYVMEAWSRGIPTVGICRGAQLLCVLNGGILAQDVSNHTGSDHGMTTMNNTMILVNTTHHQMMIPQGDYETLGWAEGLSGKYEDGKGIDRRGLLADSSGRLVEPEVVRFPMTKSLAIQYHPEWLVWEHPGRTFASNRVREMRENG